MATKTAKTAQTRTSAKQGKSYRIEGRQDNKAVLDLLQSWMEADEDEARDQWETMQYLRKALNEGRRPGYEHFP